MNFPTLYKMASDGATMIWEIRTEGAVIITRWGALSAGQQETREEIKKGKHIGKVNETTPVQQAELEAQARLEKKLKGGYVQDLDVARAGGRDAVITGGIDVMLADRFDKQADKLVYPCLIQPKLDGHRCIAMVGEGNQVTLWTRTRNPITSMPHIVEAVAALQLKPGTVLDGELYTHEYKAEFEKLSSLIRASEPREGHLKLQYHVYDLPSAKSNDERADILATIGVDFGAGPLVLVRTEAAMEEAEVMTYFAEFCADGYEGAIARNAAAPYAFGKRSTNLLKIKEFTDSEFEVVGVEEGRGKLAGHAVFVCVTETGNQFRAKMKGETNNLKQYWDNPALAIGRKLTVQYFGWTVYGNPRFPVGLRFFEAV